MLDGEWVPRRMVLKSMLTSESPSSLIFPPHT